MIHFVLTDDKVYTLSRMAYDHMIGCRCLVLTTDNNENPSRCIVSCYIIRGVCIHTILLRMSSSAVVAAVVVVTNKYHVGKT